MCIYIYIVLYNFIYIYIYIYIYVTIYIYIYIYAYIHTSMLGERTLGRSLHVLRWRFLLKPSLVRFSLFTLLDLCVSSLRRGHATLLCIVPILTDDPRRESISCTIFMIAYNVGLPRKTLSGQLSRPASVSSSMLVWCSAW